MTWLDYLHTHPKKSWGLIIFLGIALIVALWFLSSNYNFSIKAGKPDMQKKEFYTFTLASKNNNIIFNADTTLKVGGSNCYQNGTYNTFSCEKPDSDGITLCQVNNDETTTTTVMIKKGTNHYPVEIDNNQYDISQHGSRFHLINNNSDFSGEVLFRNKSTNTLKFNNNHQIIKFKLCGSNQEGKIVNGKLKFMIPWINFTNSYYQSCTNTLNFEIDNEVYTTKKQYFLTHDISTDIFLETSNNPSDYDLIKIHNDTIYIYQDQHDTHFPNITLLSMPPYTLNEPSYLKFKINNLNTKSIFSFYVANQRIMRFYYPNLIYDDNSTEPLTNNNKKLKDGVIKNFNIEFNKDENNNYNIKVTINNDKPYQHSGKIIGNQLKKILYQLATEKSPNNTLEVQNIESGKVLRENELL